MATRLRADPRYQLASANAKMGAQTTAATRAAGQGTYGGAPNQLYRPQPAAAPSAPPAPPPAPNPGPLYQSFNTSAPAAPAPVAPTPAAPPAAPPPPPVKDVDWFNSDSVYRNQANGAGSQLFDQLSQLLYSRNQGYQNIDNQRRDWGQSRDQAQTDTAEDFAGRGLLSSGMYKSALDELLADYERENQQIGTQEQQLGQQYGQRDSLSGGLDRGKLVDGNYTALASMYGLLGSQGVQTGTNYNNQLNAYRAESAQRQGGNITKTLDW